MSPLLKCETPIPSWDDLAACSGTRQGFPPARANTARGPDGTRCKPGTHFPHKREWEPLESPTGAISTELRMGTFLTRHDKAKSCFFHASIKKSTFVFDRDAH